MRKVRDTCGVGWVEARNPTNRILPNQPLQLTARSVVLIMFVGLRWVLVCRTISGKPPPQLNLGRYIAFLLNGCMTLIPKGYTPITNQKDESFYVRYDEFKDVSFVRHKYFFSIFADEPIEIYEVKNSNLRVVFKYHGSDWIFFKKAVLINSSGNKVVFNFKTYDKTTDVGSGGTVYESIDLYLSDSEAKKLLGILTASGNKKVRLSGKYYKDYILDNNRVVALTEIIEHYFGNK